jgi:hypothetical protein
MSRYFVPLIDISGIPAEIRCQKCRKFVPDIDAGFGICNPCYDERFKPLKARWIALTYLVVFAFGFGTYYWIYKLITFLY